MFPCEPRGGEESPPKFTKGFNVGWLRPLLLFGLGLNAGLRDPGPAEPGLADPGLADPGLNAGLEVPVFTGPGLAVLGLVVPGLAKPGLCDPGLAVPGRVDTGLAVTGLEVPGLADPGLDIPGLAVPGLGDPGLTVLGPEPVIAVPGLEFPGPILFVEPSPKLTKAFCCRCSSPLVGLLAGEKEEKGPLESVAEEKPLGTTEATSGLLRCGPNRDLPCRPGRSGSCSGLAGTG